MSLQKLVYDLQTRELHDLEVVEYSKILITDYHKGPSEAVKVLKLLCDKYPHTFGRKIMAQTVLELTQKSIAAVNSEEGLLVLTEAVANSIVLAHFEKEQIQWLEALFDQEVMQSVCIKALSMLNVPPRIRAKLRSYQSLPQPYDDLTGKFQQAQEFDIELPVRMNFEALKRLNCSTVEKPKPGVPSACVNLLEEELERDSRYMTDANKRIEAIEGLRCLFRVYSPSFELSQDNLLGSWIVGCMRSTNRRVRLCSLQLLSAFITDDMSADQLYALLNSRLKLTLNGTGVSPHYETVLTAWAMGARSCENYHLQYFLLKLVSQLSTSSTIKTALVFQQLQFIADSKRITPYQLFMPFWQTIATKIVTDKKDDIIAQFCDFCEVSTNVFFSRTAKFTLPTLIMQNKQDVIAKYVQAENTKPEKLVERYYAPIVAFLITASPTPLEFMERALRQVSRQAAGLGLRCLSLKPARMVLIELLKLSTGFEDKEKVTQSVKFLYPNGPDSDVIFNLMAVVTQDLCFNSAGKLFPVNRVQYLEGLELLIRSGVANLSIAATQMFTLLQSQLTDPLTSYYTLGTWHAMLEHMDNGLCYDEVYYLTLSVIAYKWASFNDLLKKRACKIWDFILSSRQFAQYAQECLFPKFPDPKYQAKFERKFPTNERIKLLRSLLGRMSQENFYIVYQGTSDLVELMQDQDFGLHLIKNNDKIGAMDDTISTLLSVGRRFKHEELRLLVAECLGSIGALDPYQITLSTGRSLNMLPGESADPPIELDSFGVFEECKVWVGYLVRFYILPELEATTDPDVQMYLGYEIQELLKFCGIGTSSEDVLIDVMQYFVADRQKASLIEPFFWTKYKLGALQTTSATYPIFKPLITYREWLRQFTFDMMCRATGANAATIFGHLCKLFSKDRDEFHFEQIALFTLPYAILNALLYSREVKKLVVLEFETVLNQKVDAQTSMIQKCVFGILDYFEVWLEKKRLTGLSQQFLTVQQTITSIDRGLLGQRAYECRDYPRAIRYWEQATDHTPEMIHSLRTMYAQLDDVDAMLGITRLQPDVNSKEELVQRYKKLRQWESALATYDAFAGSLSVWETEDAEGALECYQNRPELQLMMANAIPDGIHKPNVAAMASTSAWRIGRLEESVHWSRLSSRSIPQAISRAIFAKHQYGPDLGVSIREGRLLAMEDICRHEVTSLTQIRDRLISLQAFSEIEFYSEKVSVHGMTQRLDRVGKDTETRDYILSLYRALSSRHTPWTYYMAARDARKSGNYTKALEYVLKSANMGYSYATEEHARLLWKQGDQNEALEMLELMMDGEGLTRSASEIDILYTHWVDASGYASTQEIMDRYHQLLTLRIKSDKIHMRIARHWLKIYEAQQKTEPSARDDLFYSGRLLKRIVESLFKSMKYGSKYAEEALPKFLTMWLDFASDVASDRLREELGGFKHDTDIYKMCDERKAVLTGIQQMVMKNLRYIHAYFFYGALPQLMSRITSASPETFDTIRKIVLLVCRMYPDRALWSVIEAVNSSHSERQRRGQKIVDALAVDCPDMIGPAMKAIDTLVGLCSIDLRQDRSPTQTLRSLKFDQKPLIKSKLAIPIQKNLQCVLPDPGANLKDHVAFAPKVEFYAIQESVSIMSSLQRPKKITGRGSDGNTYSLLCKNKDDVRKDARLMDFTLTINKLLNRDPAAKSRRLQIHNYKVTPLMEQGGIIEWVDGAVPTRRLVVDLMASNNIPFNITRFVTMFDTKDTKKQLWSFEMALKELKPVLHQYFINTFADPMSWLKARTLFTRSAAVMSIVGYILGLGDRHLENILLVENTGGVLHVDFDCLFDKGLTLQRPELVPFRLTQNMIDAMGMMRYEGPFRRSCEITLELLSSNESLLMTVLEPFVYDPVVAGNSRDSLRAKLLNPENALDRIRQKLQLHKIPDPKVAFSVAAPLSVQGLVADLIKTATDPEKLSQLYVGWCPFL